MTVLDAVPARFESAGKHRAAVKYMGLFRLAQVLLGLGLALILLGLKTPAGILITAASVACIGNVILVAKKILGKDSK